MSTIFVTAYIDLTCYFLYPISSSRRRRIYVSMIISDTLEHSDRFSILSGVQYFFIHKILPQHRPLSNIIGKSLCADVVSQTLALSNDAPYSAKSSITVTLYEGLFNNLFRLTSKTTSKFGITVKEINERPKAPLSKGNDAEGELMLSSYLSGPFCNKHNHNTIQYNTMQYNTIQ